MRLLVFFGSKYLCEALFSKLAYIKNKYRSKLTDVHTKQLLVVAVAETPGAILLLLLHYKAQFCILIYTFRLMMEIFNIETQKKPVTR